MNRNLHSPSALTEFARDFEEEPDNLFTKIVNKLTNAYNTGYNSVNDIQTVSNSKIISSTSQIKIGGDSSSIMSRSSSSSSLSPDKQIVLEIGFDKSGTPSSSLNNDDTSEANDKAEELPNETAEERTMVNVLNRISNIVAARNNNLRNYKDTELHRFWMPDAKAKECYDCSQKFSTFRRKHHCRLCGQIFCSKCCNQVVPGKIIMCSGDLKVCTYCSKIVLSYLKSPDITIDLKADLKALQDDLANKLSLNQESNQNDSEPTESSLTRKISVGYQEERFVSNQNPNLTTEDRKTILQQSNSLKTLHDEMSKILPYQNCGTGLVAFLISNNKSSNKIQAIAILNAMLAAGFLIPIVPDSDQIEFDEILHYKLVRKSELMIGNDHQDLNVVAFAAHLSRSSSGDNGLLIEESFPPRSLEGSLSFQSVKNMEMDNTIRSTTKIAKQLVKSYCEHEELLLSQLLRNESLDQSWMNVLIPQCARTVNKFRPGFCINDLMDIRNYVNFKKVPGGSRNDCFIIGGVVFTKNVAHKEMPSVIERPKILLLQCAIVYERVEGKFVSIETLLLQEKEYLRNVTARILNLKPNIVLVHKNVAGIAQEMLREHGITLVLDVKLSVMERLSRCMQCDVVTSIESNIGRPKLGTCDVFYTKSFDDSQGSNKTLMFFEIYSCPRVYSFLLRGANHCELARVKKVAAILLYARYNWRFEMAFLLDAFARPPSPNPIIFDSKEQSPSKLSDSMIKEHCIDTCEKNPTHNTHKKLAERKSDDKFINIQDVNDFTDPLRAPGTLSPKSEREIVKFDVQMMNENDFRTALSSTLLSVSPFVSCQLPYLETEVGRKCHLRTHFPAELYFSKQLSDTIETAVHIDNVIAADDRELKLKPYHEFITHKIIFPVGSGDVQTLLAEFRAFGGRFPRPTSKTLKCIINQQFQKPQKASDDCIYQDALDLQNHQRLSVLFCSYYYNPKTTSSFCAQPTILEMKFYGQHDIMLGQFLQRYCFRSYICQSCNLPMMDHVRRYVHSMGCVQVQLSEDTTKTEADNIFLTSWCTLCNEMTPSVPISQDTWCLSFAKYLELRFHGHSYKKRVPDVSENGIETDHAELSNDKCSHSLHKDYVHYFSCKGFGVRFIYSPIEIWEIHFPPPILNLRKPKPFDKSQVREDISCFSAKGHEVYAKINERIAEMTTEDESPVLITLKTILNRDQLIFRQHVENVHTLLKDQLVHSFDISDTILKVKRALAESIELWGPRLYEAASQAKTIQRQESSPIIVTGSEEDSPLDQSTSTHLGKLKESTTSQSNHEHISDKKTIKQLLSQLLPSASQINSLQSPLSSNEHHTLPLGEFPVLVHDQDISSIIAYALVSIDYRKAIDNLHLSSGYHSDPANSPNSKRKFHDGAMDGGDDSNTSKLDDDKKSKSRSHFELLFQDMTTQFICKIYFAKEFDAIRASVVRAPEFEKKESNKMKTTDSSQEKQESDNIRKFFARSLSKSLQWEARGGKSGSKFSKTLDDRFVIKEMTKGDVTIFESFAPNYFDYINKCVKKNQPTLLAKILGVFRVTIKKKESVHEKSVLVMENLFYDCDIKNKFDLKGSERNRLVNPENQSGEIVLLDENLINMSWSKPLYILSHSKTILREAINRDSSFLERNSVMDYSLLVGLNNKNNNLVLGIIDYIRTFTFDKRLESLVKQTGILGGQGKLPTVIAPQRYKQRFTEAMERYFYSVPDRWEGLSKK